MSAVNRTYMVTVGNRLQFEAMAPDSCTLVCQHMDLCGPGEKIAVQSLDSYRAWKSLQAQADRTQRDELYRQPLGGYLS